MNRRDLETQLQALFDRTLDRASFKALEEQLRSDPEAREIYRDYLHLHHLLTFRAGDVISALPIKAGNLPETKPARFPKRTILAIAAMILGIAAVGMGYKNYERSPLRFAVSPGTNISVSNDFAPADGRTGNNQKIEPGSRFEIGNGTIELKFSSGVRGIVRGPAKLILFRKDLLQLERGTAWFSVPQNADGFKVSTPDLILGEGGTEFGVVTDPAFQSEVHVFGGTVEATNRHGGKFSKWVTAGQAEAAEDGGEWQDIPVRRGLFVTHLPGVEPESNVIVTKEFSTTQFAYANEVSNDDLLTGITPTTTGWKLENDASPLDLTDGIHGAGYTEIPGKKVQGAWTTVGATAEYHLGTGPNGTGYNITMVRSIADWVNVGFGNQAWTMEVKPAGKDWCQLASVVYEPLKAQPLTGGGGGTKVTVTGKDGRLAQGIEAIKVTAGRVPGSVDNAFVWRELDVFGAPTEASHSAVPDEPQNY